MTSILYSFDFNCIYVEINILLFTGFQILFFDSIPPSTIIFFSPAVFILGFIFRLVKH